MKTRWTVSCWMIRPLLQRLLSQVKILHAEIHLNAVEGLERAVHAEAAAMEAQGTCASPGGQPNHSTHAPNGAMEFASDSRSGPGPSSNHSAGRCLQAENGSAVSTIQPACLSETLTERREDVPRSIGHSASPQRIADAEEDPFPLNRVPVAVRSIRYLINILQCLHSTDTGFLP